MSEESRRLYPEIFADHRGVDLEFGAESEFNRMEWVEKGLRATLAATVARSRELSIPLPDWAAAAVLELLSEAPRKAKPGRNNSPEARAKQDAVDLERWFAVYQIKHGVSDLANRLEAAGHKTDWENIYDTVSDLLRGEPAWGGPRAIRHSYLKMQKGNKTPDIEALENS